MTEMTASSVDRTDLSPEDLEAIEKGLWDGVERRKPEDRRNSGPDRRLGVTKDGKLDPRVKLDRRRGPGRRRSDSRRMAEEGEMTDEQFEFLLAVDEYKKANNRPFPTWTEVLDIIHALGYRKVAEPGPLR